MLNFKKQSGLIPACDMTDLIITDCLYNFGTWSNVNFVPLPSFSRLWDLDFQIKCKIQIRLKGTLNHWARFFFSLAQVRHFWHLWVAWQQKCDMYTLWLGILSVCIQSTPYESPTNMFGFFLHDNVLKGMVLTFAGAPFTSTLFSPAQLSMNMHACSIVATNYKDCLLHFGKVRTVSHECIDDWPTETPFKGLGKLCWCSATVISLAYDTMTLQMNFLKNLILWDTEFYIFIICKSESVCKKSDL